MDEEASKQVELNMAMGIDKEHEKLIETAKDILLTHGRMAMTNTVYGPDRSIADVKCLCGYKGMDRWENHVLSELMENAGVLFVTKDEFSELALAKARGL